MKISVYFACILCRLLGTRSDWFCIHADYNSTDGSKLLRPGDHADGLTAPSNLTLDHAGGLTELRDDTQGIHRHVSHLPNRPIGWPVSEVYGFFDLYL